jgi:hypothetical protein
MRLAGLVLRLTQNGRLLGRWSLSGAPLEMCLTDAESGEVVGVFSAALPERERSDELPVPTQVSGPERIPGDDLTMPLPETQVHAGGKEVSATIDVEAELWVRSRGQWQKRGVLKPGQKASFVGSKVRLKRNGVLVVEPGPTLSGGADLPTGGELEIHVGQEPLRFPPGTSVILTSPEGGGFYVKSRLGDTGFRTIVEHSTDWVSPTNTYVPPSSDWG